MTVGQHRPPQLDSHEPPLSAPLRLVFDYTRSLGPTLGAFFTALRERRIVGIRGSDGRVLVPPAEFDPVTCERLTEIVPVAAIGTVRSWTWQSEPVEGQPLDRPFAWALIQLDGADTALLHAVDGPVKTGDRVRAHWVDEPVGSITDIAYFTPGDDPEPPVAELDDDRDPVQMIVTPCDIAFEHTASLPESTYLRALQQGKLLGARAGDNGKVYFPPREADPATGRELDQFVELPDHGHRDDVRDHQHPVRRPADHTARTSRPTSCSTARISPSCIWSPVSTRPRSGWACGCEAVWKPREQWGLGIDNIEHFRPTGEPDADYDTYKHHL